MGRVAHPQWAGWREQGRRQTLCLPPPSPLNERPLFAMRFLVPVVLILALLAGVWMLRTADAPSGVETEMAEPTFGPADGFDLPPTDIDRVAVGTVAPDFTLMAYSRDPVTLSDYRGEKDVILVFYRGHW